MGGGAIVPLCSLRLRLYAEAKLSDQSNGATAGYDLWFVEVIKLLVNVGVVGQDWTEDD